MELERGTVRVLLAHGHALFREAIRTVLDSEPGLEVVGEATDGRQALEVAAHARPQVALVDASLPVLDGVEVARWVRQHLPDCRVLVLGEEEQLEPLLDLLEAGASGYVTKGCPLTQLIESARAIHRGEVVIPQRLLGALLATLIRRRREREAAFRQLARLTPRERKVLALLIDGADNQAIAASLVISPETARTHVHNLLSKLKVRSRLDAATFVTRNGLLDELTGAET